jgi:Tfp pilus assembly protein PilF
VFIDKEPAMTLNSRSHIFALFGIACLALSSGCAPSSLLSTSFFGPSKASTEDADIPAADRAELPPMDAARACLAAAEEMQRSGNIEQAIALYEKARANNPNLKSVAHHLAVLYDAQGDSVRSLAEYTKALEAEPKNAAVLSDFGYYYYERERYAEAEKSLRKALEIDPNNGKALCNLGLVLAAEGRFDESFESFSKTVGPAAAHSNLGVLLAKQGRYDQAKRAFHQALALDPTLPQPRVFLDYLDHKT